jgi:hypothetical protein
MQGAFHGPHQFVVRRVKQNLLVRGAAREHQTSDIRESHPKDNPRQRQLYDRFVISYLPSQSPCTGGIPPVRFGQRLGKHQSYIPDCSDGISPYERHIRPLSTTSLIRVPGDAGLTSISMLH